MPKNIILKNKKNSLSEKIIKSKKLQGRILGKSNKGLDILLLLPQRGCIPYFRKFGSSDLEKMSYGQTDGTEIIGPSGKIPWTKKKTSTFLCIIINYGVQT